MVNQLVKERMGYDDAGRRLWPQRPGQFVCMIAYCLYGVYGENVRLFVLDYAGFGEGAPLRLLQALIFPERKAAIRCRPDIGQRRLHPWPALSFILTRALKRPDVGPGVLQPLFHLFDGDFLGIINNVIDLVDSLQSLIDPQDARPPLQVRCDNVVSADGEDGRGRLPGRLCSGDRQGKRPRQNYSGEKDHPFHVSTLPHAMNGRAENTFTIK